MLAAMETVRHRLLTIAPPGIARMLAVLIASIMVAPGAPAFAEGGSDPSVTSDRVDRNLDHSQRVHDLVEKPPANTAPRPAATKAWESESADFDARAAALARKIDALLVERGLVKEDRLETGSGD
jgi:hypothetical protein